jgi:ribonuclease-3
LKAGTPAVLPKVRYDKSPFNKCSGSPNAGHGNNLVSTIGSNANLAIVARDAGIDQHVILNPGHIGRVSDKTLATTIEAILGAVYLDTAKDTEAVKRTMTLLGLTS